MITHVVPLLAVAVDSAVGEGRGVVEWGVA